MTDHRIVFGDWREVLPGLPAGEAALAIVDGPYNMRKAEWDKFASWDEFRAWYAPLWAELGRALRDNCSLYVWGTFASLAALKPDLDAMGGGWQFRSRIIWHKTNALPQKGWQSYRSFPPMTEDLLFYARERVDISALAREDNSVRAYLNTERERAGVTVREVAEAFQRRTGTRTVTGMASHWFGNSQWTYPTAENYQWLRDLFNSRNGGEYLRREYEDLRAEYEGLRYPFNPQMGVTDVWEVPICAGAERVKLNGETAHVAQKPIALYERIIAASSNPGDLVLDPMAGTGTTAVACERLGRRSICIEQDETYAAIARARIDAAGEVAPAEELQSELPF